MAERQGRGSEPVRRFLPILLLVASLLSLVISTRSLAGLPERIGLGILGFFERGLSSVGTFVSDTAGSIRSLRRLRADYDSLLERTKDLDRIERDYAGLRAENQRLREQLGFKAGGGYAKVAARVIAKDPGNVYATIMIDKGIGDGIRKNMAVVAWQEGVQGLVGRVIEASQGVSMVVPLYDSSSHVAARLDKSRYEGLLSGQGSDEQPLILNYIRKRARDETQAGDLVVSSGLDSIYPSDLALGRVRRIHELEYRTSLDIDVEPILDFTKLEYVFVILGKGTEPEGQGTGGDAGGQG